MKTLPNVAFYFIRHGQTDANAKGLMCGGDWDIELNDVGHSESIKQSKLLITIDDKIDTLFVSPMKRTMQTASNLNQLLKAKVVIDHGLIEWCVGDWEYRPWDEVPNPFNTTEDPPNGESRVDFEKRVISTIYKILMSATEKPLIVSHGAFAHTLFTWMGIDQAKIENCKLYRISPIGLSWLLEKVDVHSL